MDKGVKMKKSENENWSFFDDDFRAQALKPELGVVDSLYQVK